MEDASSFERVVRSPEVASQPSRGGSRWAWSLRINVVALVLLGLCAVLTVQMNRILVQNRALEGENQRLHSRLILQQEATVVQMQQRLALIHMQSAGDSSRLDDSE